MQLCTQEMYPVLKMVGSLCAWRTHFEGVCLCVCARTPLMFDFVWDFSRKNCFYLFIWFVLISSLSFRTWFCLFNLCLQFWFLMWGTKNVVTNRLLRCTLACLLRLLVETRAFTTYFFLETEIVRKAWQTSDGVRRKVCRCTTMIARHWWSSQQEEEEE